jgi:hypothetical protein
MKLISRRVQSKEPVEIDETFIKGINQLFDFSEPKWYGPNPVFKKVSSQNELEPTP